MLKKCNTQPAELCAYGVAIMQCATNELEDTVITFNSIAFFTKYQWIPIFT
jgi:hypothetical protein